MVTTLKHKLLRIVPQIEWQGNSGMPQQDPVPSRYGEAALLRYNRGLHPA
jgi:hypothetical protein